jgi:hypothetical protein
MEVALVISITMPVLNEELLIAQTLAATRQTIGDAKQIDNGSSLTGECEWEQRGGDAGGDVCAAHV